MAPAAPQAGARSPGPRGRSGTRGCLIAGLRLPPRGGPARRPAVFPGCGAVPGQPPSRSFPSQPCVPGPSAVRPHRSSVPAAGARAALLPQHPHRQPGKRILVFFFFFLLYHKLACELIQPYFGNKARRRMCAMGFSIPQSRLCRRSS